MKLIFRDKHNGRFLTPIQVLPNYVRLANLNAKRYGVGVILVYPDGSMKSTDPRGVVLK